MLAEHPHEVLFVVLNYDTMLETALTAFDSQQLTFKSIRNYTAARRQAGVVKLHGSTDWFVKFGNAHGGRTWDNEVRDLDISHRPAENEIVVNDRVTSVRDSSGATYIYPLVTAPLAGKELGDVVCPDSHIEHAREFIASCRKFLIIGTSRPKSLK